MQVFLPYPDFESSLAVLDNKRLGNQIYNECFILIQGGWINHPCSKIWINHKKALAEYCLVGLDELNNRGRNYPRWIEFYNYHYYSQPNNGYPDIIGYEPFHAGMRSQLLLKNYNHYSRFNWKESPGEFPYVWKRF